MQINKFFNLLNEKTNWKHHKNQFTAVGCYEPINLSMKHESKNFF